MSTDSIIYAAANKNADSAINYAAVDVSSVDYEPASPFRGIHIGTGGAGDITITGHNGTSVTLKVGEGLLPIGGIAIVSATTTATEITALF